MNNQVKDPRYLEVETEVRSLSGEQLLNYLRDKHMSDVYLIIRDMLTDIQKKQLNKEFPQVFKHIQQEAKASWDNDHRTALISDVNRAVTNAYHLTLQMIKQINDDQTRIKDVIDEMREKLGYEQIDWVNSPNTSAVIQTEQPNNEDQPDCDKSSEGQ